MATQQARTTYAGVKAQLAIAVDVGNAFSGASYTFLLPKEVPRVYCVTGYKGQEDQPMNTRVPTVLYYDSNSKLVACGSEPIDDEDEANEGLTKVEWFKTLIGGKALRKDLPTIIIPDGLSVVDLMADFLGYMTNCVRDYVFETHVEGRSLWKSTIDEAAFLLSHPNGWNDYQLGQMHTAAIQAGLISDTPEGRERLEFLTEGEASFHWCVDGGLTESSLTTGSIAVIADAGEWDIDVSCFRVLNLRPFQLVEANDSVCRMAGSNFVTQAFEVLVEEKLKGSRWFTSDRMERVVEEFDRKGTCLFRDASTTTYVRLGSSRDNDPARGIRMGKIAFTGREIASTFERSCREAAEAIKIQVSGKAQTSVFLVGGFAASPWLYEELKHRLSGVVDKIHRAESQTAKAIAHGALVYYLNQANTSRTPKRTYSTWL